MGKTTEPKPSGSGDHSQQGEEQQPTDPISPQLAALTLVHIPPIACKPYMLPSHFQNIEAIFDLNNCRSERARYCNVLIKLTDEQREKYAVIIDQANSAEQSYTYFKEQVLKRFGLTSDERLRIITSAKSLGDRTPSELLTFLRLINNKESTIAFVFHIWRNCLPPNIQQLLLVSDENLTVDEIALIADKCYSTMPEKQTSHLYEVSASASQYQDTTREPNVDAIQDRRQSRPRAQYSRGHTPRPQSGRRNTGWQKPRSPSPGYRKDGNQPMKNGLCFYHKTYGTHAHKCQPGCKNFKNFKPKKPNSGNANPGKYR
jgi:hypothetical protein